MIRLVAIVVLATACTALEPAVTETAQAASVCADGPTTFGIDVSRFQGDINWAQVKGAGVKFAWIQISRSLTDIDVKFPYNWQQAKANGILRGAYQRFHPAQDVMAQAKLFLDKLGPFEAGDMPPMLDVEDSDGLNATQIATAVKQWMDYVEPRVGVTPIIYTGYYFWRDSVASADFSQHPLWIANYSATCPLVPDHWTRWAFHQYSSTVMLPGITANTVDVNKFNGTIEDLKALAAVPSCGDGMCNGDETADSCPADCEPCQVIGEGTDAIVDDSSACFQAGGDPMYMREANAGYGSSLRWTNATDAADVVSYGKWNLFFAQAGTYRVEAFTPAPYNGSKQAVYQVSHGDTVSPVTIDQSAIDGWTVIGDFEFVAGGNGQYIRIDDNTGEPSSTETKIVFDALRFTPVSPDDPPGDDDPPPGDGGCTTSRGGSSLAVALAAFLLRRRRREKSPRGR
jgi:GH25 family lysozyme M1 (1,4-beta-N-acetylmuramidase)